MGVKGYFIQYKFILPENIKHSSYTYQKLFRALYGYTQAVDKASGKRYKYHRRGVLSEIPHIRPGKNCVIIPTEHFQRLKEFFHTGKNPSHNWRGKGDWKANYYLDDKAIKDEDAIKALEEVLDKGLVFEGINEPISLFNAMKKLSESSQTTQEKTYLVGVFQKAKEIVNSDWFKTVYPSSEKLGSFYSGYKKLKTSAGLV